MRIPPSPEPSQPGLFFQIFQILPLAKDFSGVLRMRAHFPALVADTEKEHNSVQHAFHEISSESSFASLTLIQFHNSCTSCKFEE